MKLALLAKGVEMIKRIIEEIPPEEWNKFLDSLKKDESRNESKHSQGEECDQETPPEEENDFIDEVSNSEEF